MRSPVWLSLVLVAALTACGGASSTLDRAVDSKPEPKAQSANAGEFTHSVAQDSVNTPDIKQVSLTQSETLASSEEAADRKIIRNANLTMEVSSTTEAQHRVTSIAESHGGFVVTSESKQREDAEPAKRTLDIKLVVRIPATQFGGVLDEIRGRPVNRCGQLSVEPTCDSVDLFTRTAPDDDR